MKVPFQYRREEHRHLLAPHRDATLGSVAGPGRTEGVNMQSGSASPAIAIAPRSVVQVRMPDDGSTVSGAGEGEAVSMVSAGEDVNLGEENELCEDDDEEEVDEINHAKLPRETIRAHSPGRRAHTSEAWTYLRRIHKD